MIRIGLVSYLLIMTAAGPVLCCCETGRALNGIVAAAMASSGKKPDSESPRTCCGHRKSTETSQSPASKESSEKPLPEDRSCPCKKNTTPDVILFANDGKTVNACQRELALDSHRSLAAAFSMAFEMPNGRPQVNGQLLLPFLTSTDLLDVHHLLRC